MDKVIRRLQCHRGRLKKFKAEKYRGVEKICLNSLCFQNIETIKSMVDTFGGQSVVASLDVKKTILGGYKLYDSSCSNLHQADYFETHLEQLLEAGVGEIMLGAIDKEGTLSGPDLVLINKVSEKIGVPLISFLPLDLDANVC